jgi:cytochrome c5
MVITLEDGARVEVRWASELQLEKAVDGVRLRLNAGSVIVNATPQRTGHLYVETRDVVGSVVGTVFLVRAEKAGTRVAVIDGEVQVQQGSTQKKLAAGEHMATNASLESLSVVRELSWSRNAVAHLALLERSAPVQAEAALSARQDPAQRQISPIRVEPINVTPIRVAPINVTPIPPSVAPPPRQQNPLPEGPGQDVFNRACSTCHSADAVTALRFRNKAEVAELINRQNARGANVSEPEFTMLVDYLFANLRKKK